MAIVENWKFIRNTESVREIRFFFQIKLRLTNEGWNLAAELKLCKNGLIWEICNPVIRKEMGTFIRVKQHVAVAH